MFPKNHYTPFLHIRVKSLMTDKYQTHQQQKSTPPLSPLPPHPSLPPSHPHPPSLPPTHPKKRKSQLKTPGATKSATDFLVPSGTHSADSESRLGPGSYPRNAWLGTFPKYPFGAH